MSFKKLYGFILAIALALSGYSLSAQNLVPNPSFENLSICPQNFGGVCGGQAVNWSCGNTATTDLFNVCTSNIQLSVPSNAYGTENPVSGVGYAGMVCKFVTQNYREYVLAQLTTPLTAGTWYNVNFYISLAEGSCASEHMGAYFSATSPYQNQWTVLLVNPQIDYEYGYLTETDGWTLITGCFQAAGGEAYITIGNFHDDMETSYYPGCSGLSYYYIDEISVVEGSPSEELAFDLGGPEFACFEYTIDPGLTGVYYHWEDGSTGPTLTVTQSGTYTLTISDGCNIGIDSIEVVIGGGNPAVDIGPASVVICEGDAYSISLDPDLFEYEWNDGTTGPDFSITEAGIYSVTLDDGCTSSTDAIEVSMMSPPLPFDLGDDGPLCSGDLIDYNFDPGLGDFIWQDGSMNSIYTIEEGGTYSLTISNMCGEVSDDITIFNLDVPEVELGPDDLDLCTGEIHEASIDPTLGEILWPDGSSQPDFYISTSGVYTVFVTNECGTGSDVLNVTYHDPPVFDLGPDLNLCPADTVNLIISGVEGDFNWQNQSTDSTYQITQSGTYSLQVSNICGQMTDSLHVTYQPFLSPVDLGPDVTLCPGEEVILHAGSPSANHLWNDMSTADTLLVNSAGTYYVEISNACSTYSDTIIVSVNGNPPQVDLPDNLILCQGQSLLLDAVVTGVSYAWSDMSSQHQLSVSVPGTYSVTVTNTCGSDADTVVVLDGGPAPLVDLGQDTALCSAASYVLSPVSSNVDQWLWQDGSGNTSLSISAPGLYSVIVSNACGSAYDTLAVSALPDVPSFDLGADTSLCPGQSLMLSITIPNVDILWPDGSQNTTFTVDGPGEITASISNTCGVANDTLVVTGLQNIPLLELGPDQSLCPGETITFDPGIANVDYLWQDGSTATSYASTQEETVILIISNLCGTATDTAEIIENNQGPQVDLGPDIQVCSGEIVTIPSGISGVNYQWQDGSTNSSYVAAQSGVFILQVSNACGLDADTILVDISGTPPIVALGQDTTLCEGATLLLQSSADTQTMIEWQDGSTAPNFLVNLPGTYSLSASNRCGTDTDTILISYLPRPQPFLLGPDTLLCPGETLILQAPYSGFPLLWQDGSTLDTLVISQQGLYSLSISNSCGAASDEVLVSYDTRIPLIALDDEYLWCPGDVIALDATQSFPATYLWSTGETSSQIEVITPGIFTLDISTSCAQASHTLSVVEDTDCEVLDEHHAIYIPNVFSPNGDNFNDFFMPTWGADAGVMDIDGRIFDRWGNLVFQQHSLSFAWDGNFNGKPVMPGVYAYVMRFTIMINGSAQTLIRNGDVTLIR